MVMKPSRGAAAPAEKPMKQSHLVAVALGVVIERSFGALTIPAPDAGTSR